MLDIIGKLFFFMIALIPLIGGTFLLALFSQIAVDMIRGAGEGEVENNLLKSFSTIWIGLLFAGVFFTLWPDMIKMGRGFSLLFWAGIFTSSFKLSYRMEWPQAGLAAIPSTLAVWEVIYLLKDIDWL